MLDILEKRHLRLAAPPGKKTQTMSSQTVMCSLFIQKSVLSLFTYNMWTICQLRAYILDIKQAVERTVLYSSSAEGYLTRNSAAGRFVLKTCWCIPDLGVLTVVKVPWLLLRGERGRALVHEDL